MLKSLRKRKNCVIELCQQPRKVPCMYLAFKNLKVSRSFNYKLNWKKQQTITYLGANKEQTT